MMLESLNTTKYDELVSVVVDKITQNDVNKFAEILYSIAEGVMSGESSVQENLEGLLDRVGVPDNCNEDAFMSHLVGIFIGLELAKQGELDAK